jgi:hypothetical protein
MLINSRFTSSVDNPIILEENSWDFKTLLIVIAGHPCRAEERCYDWDDGKNLYLLMQKYQLDRLQPWFSKMAGEYAGESPFEALCMASMIILLEELYSTAWKIELQSHCSIRFTSKRIKLISTKNTARLAFSIRPT